MANLQNAAEVACFIVKKKHNIKRLLSSEIFAHFLCHTTPQVSAKYPVVISEFIEGGREIDVDAVAHNGKVGTRSVKNF